MKRGNHDLARAEGAFVCTACCASWKVRPRSRCPGIQGLKLYRRWSDIPDTLGTKTMIRRAGMRLPKGSKPVAMMEDGFHFRYRLYPVALGEVRRPRTEREQQAMVAVRRLLGTCQGCGQRPEDRADLLRRRDYRRYDKDLAEDRLCIGCYAVRWRVQRDRVIAERRAALRALLPDFAVIDFETTALHRPSAIEVAVWGADGLLFRALIDPGPDALWEPEASAVHGIEPWHVVCCPLWPEVEADLLAVLSERGITFLGAWGSFDKGVVWSERSRRNQEGTWPVSWVNLMDAYDIDLRRDPPFWRGREPRGSPSMTSLYRACKRYAIAPGNHRAAEDARAAYQVFEAMLVEPSSRTSPPPSEPSRPPAEPDPAQPGSHDG